MRRPKLIIFDLDGTLYRGEQGFPGVPETVGWIREQGILVRFLTNNSGNSLAHVTAKLERFGFCPQPNEVMTTAVGAAMCLKKHNLNRIMVVGDKGLHDTLLEAGIEITETNAEAVLVGICRSVTYDLIDKAQNAIRAGAKFFATNTDATYPIEGDRVQPGAGAIVAAVATSSQTSPVVIGKPEPYLIQILLEQARIEARNCWIVGDRPQTDLDAAVAAKCTPFLVLSGVTSEPGNWQHFGKDVTALKPLIESLAK